MSWVIAQTNPGSEDAAERALRLAGYRTFVPRYRGFAYPHGRDRRPTIMLRPVFMRICFAQDWYGWPSISISSITGLMMLQPGNAAMLSDADIAVIMDRERNREFDEVRAKPAGGLFEVGDEVEIDAFGARILGVLEELSDDGKAVVRAMLLGRAVRTSVSAARLHIVSC
jgi:hypothetical protein